MKQTKFEVPDVMYISELLNMPGTNSSPIYIDKGLAHFS